jgi:hypothetical protein
MKQTFVDIFAELGRRLLLLGGDTRTREIIERAVETNPWFSEGGIVRAAKALSMGMLSRQALTVWLAGYPDLPVVAPRRVLIVMAGNIPFVGFADLLCVLAAGHSAVVKTSSKDTVLVTWLIEQLYDISPTIPISYYDWRQSPDALVAMGGNDAIRSLSGRYGDIPTLLRGSRSSVAVLGGDETSEQLSALADDILSYSGLGCRNVSLVFVPVGFDIGRFANALGSYPLGVNPKYASNCRQVKAILSMKGATFTDCEYCILHKELGVPSQISQINYFPYTFQEEISRWLAAHDDEIQCVVGSIAHPRAVGFGESQSPTLVNYPDGRDTMQFLASI